MSIINLISNFYINFLVSIIYNVSINIKVGKINFQFLYYISYCI